MIENIMHNLKILWRADSIIAEARLRQALTRSGMTIVAAFFAALALGMLNVAGLFALAPLCGNAWAACAVAGVDVVLAGIVLGASKAKAGRELSLALETRQAALSALDSSAQALQRQVTAIGDDVQQTSRAVQHIANDPLYASLPTLIVPLAGILLKAMKAHNEQKRSGA